MALLVRKISRGKWPEEICELSSLAGDAISDIRTFDNSLSVWLVDSEDEIGAAMLALSASSKTESIEGITIVWIPVEKIEAKSILVKSDCPGDTIVSDLTGTHRDLSEITFKSLGILAEIIMDELIRQKHYKRFKRTEVRDALVKAYNDRRISEEKCTPKLLEEIKKAVKNQSPHS